MNRAAAWGIGISGGGRIIPAPRPVVAGNRPEVSLLGLPASRIEHRCRSLVHRNLARAEDQFAHSQVNWREFGSRIAHPERQDGAFDVESLRAENLGLPVEREMPSVFGNRKVG